MSVSVKGTQGPHCHDGYLNSSPSSIPLIEIVRVVLDYQPPDVGL